MSDATLLSGVGYVRDTIPYDIFAQLTAEASLAREKEIYVDLELAGAIKEEYNIGSSDFILGEFFNYIVELIGRYEQTFSGPTTIRQSMLSYPLLRMENIDRTSLISNWVNYQKKFEYNPPHKHNGLWSYVIWINLPYNIEEEKEKYKSNTEFNFQFTANDGLIQQHSVDPKEGDIILFPAELWHSVNPFFLSDDFRVSLSGNIFAVQPEEIIWKDKPVTTDIWIKPPNITTT